MYSVEVLSWTRIFSAKGMSDVRGIQIRPMEQLVDFKIKTEN